jgi:hypothetical protein
MNTPHLVRRDRGEVGTSLILALVFVFVIGIVLVAVGGLAANALLNTSNLRSQRTSATDAESAMTIAMQLARYTYMPPTPPRSPVACLPLSSQIPSSDAPRITTVNPISVYCSVAANSSGRVVQFYACPQAVIASACDTPGELPVLLYAQGTYDDQGASGLEACSRTTTTTCGIGMDVDVWDLTIADS